MKSAWLDILKIIYNNIKSVKGLSKALAKYITVFILRLSGPQGWVTSAILSKVISWGIIEAKDIVQHWKDNKTIKEGDKLEKLPPTEEVKKKRKKNLKKLIEGKK